MGTTVQQWASECESVSQVSFYPRGRRWAEGSDEGEISCKKLELKLLVGIIPPHPPFRALLPRGEKETSQTASSQG